MMAGVFDWLKILCSDRCHNVIIYSILPSISAARILDVTVAGTVLVSVKKEN
jgi:hypothetical protein